MSSKRTWILGAVSLAVVFSTCSSTSKGTPTNVTSTTLEVAGPNPSISAKMICGEAKEEIAQSAIGRDTVRALAPKWSDHVYSCDYGYGGGARMALSVKEMSSVDETTAYFDATGARRGRGPKLEGLGQGAFPTTDGSVVVRKDYRVLLVDVAHLPATFGLPPRPRAEVAIAVASTIMGCWTGA